MYNTQKCFYKSHIIKNKPIYLYKPTNKQIAKPIKKFNSTPFVCNVRSYVRNSFIFEIYKFARLCLQFKILLKYWIFPFVCVRQPIYPSNHRKKCLTFSEPFENPQQHSIQFRKLLFVVLLFSKLL